VAPARTLPADIPPAGNAGAAHDAPAAETTPLARASA
jgi:hypothetical protein